jgi:hypothetical protein
MQQQLFQLEQEKVRTQVQMNNQLLQLGKESRHSMKLLDDLGMQQLITQKEDG